MRDILLDTGPLIQVDRGRMAVGELYRMGSDPGLPAIVLAELVAGMYGTTDPKAREKRRQFNQWVAATFKVFPMAGPVVDHLGYLMDFSKKSGNPRGDADLEVAATALATGRLLVTRDKKARFEGLPGLDVLQIP